MTDDGGTRPVSRAGRPLLVDSHVHFHECFTWPVFLAAAARNFDEGRRQHGLSRDVPGCLMFTESAGANSFAALFNRPQLARAAGWEVRGSDDGCSMTLDHGVHGSIVLVAGRQVVTRERLEVLALGCVDPLEDGRSLDSVLDRVAENGGVGIIPWGFGKWWGPRGRIVRAVIERCAGSRFCLGDNGGRPRGTPRPKLFALAEDRGIPVLAGSDPLPLPDHVGRAGSYGFVLQPEIAAPSLQAAVNIAVAALVRTPPSFGRLSSVVAAARSQFGLRRVRRPGVLRRAPLVS